MMERGPMRFAIDVAPLGPLADPAAIAELARAAEEGGWDGISVWDSLGVSMSTESADPFVALTVAAAATEHLALIASVVALPRRRPQLVAQSAGTLDRFSHGRLVLGLGSGGDPADFTSFGESFDPRRRAAMLDEGAGVLDRLLRGETVEHAGEAYTVSGVSVGPRPARRPRPPIWIGGMKGAALRRAARWDGWIAIAVDESGAMTLTPDQLVGMVATIREHRASPDPFDVAVFATSERSEAATVDAFAAAGATWWLESLSPMRGPMDVLLGRIGAGPAIN